MRGEIPGRDTERAGVEAMEGVSQRVSIAVVRRAAVPQLGIRSVHWAQVFPPRPRDGTADAGAGGGLEDDGGAGSALGASTEACGPGCCFKRSVVRTALAGLSVIHSSEGCAALGADPSTCVLLRVNEPVFVPEGHGLFDVKRGELTDTAAAGASSALLDGLVRLLQCAAWRSAIQAPLVQDSEGKVGTRQIGATWLKSVCGWFVQGGELYASVVAANSDSGWRGRPDRLLHPWVPARRRLEQFAARAISLRRAADTTQDGPQPKRKRIEHAPRNIAGRREHGTSSIAADTASDLPDLGTQCEDGMSQPKLLSLFHSSELPSWDSMPFAAPEGPPYVAGSSHDAGTLVAASHGWGRVELNGAAGELTPPAPLRLSWEGNGSGGSVEGLPKMGVLELPQDWFFDGVCAMNAGRPPLAAAAMPRGRFSRMELGHALMLFARVWLGAQLKNKSVGGAGDGGKTPELASPEAVNVLPSAVVGRFGRRPVQIPHKFLTEWIATGLSPYGPRKACEYCLICPAGQREASVALVEEIGASFAHASLGYHIPHRCLPTVIGVKMIRCDATASEIAGLYEAAAFAIVRSSGERGKAETRGISTDGGVELPVETLVYAALPTELLLSRPSAEIELIRQAINHRLVSTFHGRVNLGAVECVSLFGSREGPTVSFGALAQRSAFSVYQKLAAQRVLHGSLCCKPLFTIAASRGLGSSLWKQLGADLDSPDAPTKTMYLAYAVEESRVAYCIVDASCELKHFAVLPHKTFADVAAHLLAVACRYCAKLCQHELNAVAFARAALGGSASITEPTEAAHERAYRTALKYVPKWGLAITSLGVMPATHQTSWLSSWADRNVEESTWLRGIALSSICHDSVAVDTACGFPVPPPQTTSKMSYDNPVVCFPDAVVVPRATQTGGVRGEAVFPAFVHSACDGYASLLWGSQLAGKAWMIPTKVQSIELASALVDVSYGTLSVVRGERTSLLPLHVYALVQAAAIDSLRERGRRLAPQNST